MNAFGLSHKSVFKSCSQIPAGPMARGGKSASGPQPVPDNADLVEMSYLEAPPLMLGCVFLTKQGPGCTEGFGSFPKPESGADEHKGSATWDPSWRSAGQGWVPHTLQGCYHIPSPSNQSAATSGKKRQVTYQCTKVQINEVN